MFNTTHIKMGSNTSEVTLNTPSHGIMQRSHPKSRFIRFSKGSDVEKWVFNRKEEKAYCNKLREEKSYDDFGKPITVLQIMVFGDIQYLCEVVNDEDLNDDNESQLLTNKK